MATGDCLHPLWLDAIKKLPRPTGSFSGRYAFRPQRGGGGQRRVHHLIFLPDTGQGRRHLQEAFAPYSTNLSADGRPGGIERR